MEAVILPERLRKLEIPGHVTVATGRGGLPKMNVATGESEAEIYLHGAHVTGFQKKGEPPLLFLSARSHFAPNQPIRGGVPVCFPWFGNRNGGPSHGFARITEWQPVKTSAAPDGTVTLAFALPPMPGRDPWKSLRTELVVTVADTLTMELITVNDACGEALEIEDCLHAYFSVGDISAVSITGLQGLPFDDFASGAHGTPRPASDAPLPVKQETNRVYPNHSGAVEIHDGKLRRTIRVEKFNSQSTVVWNPWTTQKLADDFDPAEHRQMICVEAGNVKQNKILLAPGRTTNLKVILGSHPL